MKIKFGNKEFILLIGYHENKYKIALNNLVQQIFNISFEQWSNAGYWIEKYIPYTLFDGKKAIANVSVNIMDFSIFGDQKRYIQIGTVMTDEKYRNHDLSRFLMEKVLDEWNEKCDLIYLFANGSVLKFYPKFGFEIVKEYVHFKKTDDGNSAKHADSMDVEKLNMDEQTNRDLLYDYAKNSKVFGKISMRENADLVMFYCISILKDHVYYIKSLDIIVVATVNDHQLQLWDVFGKVKVALDLIIDSLMNKNINEVMLGFTPLDCSSYKNKERLANDEFLFIQKGKTSLFTENHIMFPLLSHA